MDRAIVHLYPFEPWGWHGGTMRLRTALQASALVGKPILYWFDRARKAWIHEHDLSNVGRPAQAATHDQTSMVGLKRFLFPSTLYESGGIPVRAFLAEQIPPTSIVVLHTSYLSPLIRRVRAAGARKVIVDVHDVVSGAHMDDASHGPAPVRVLRYLYAKTVSYREQRALAQADALAVAGWGDTRLLVRSGLAKATWAPTGIEAKLSDAPEGNQLRVGLLGNFQHSTTAVAAAELISSPLGRDPAVEMILAGIGSERYGTSARVQSLGRLMDTGEFYDQVHATVVPIMNGTGMKCKLAEAALSGKAVVTTRLGAVGYPPELSRGFVIVNGAESLDRRVITDAIERLSPETVRANFESVVGCEAAAHTYASMLKSANNMARAREPRGSPPTPSTLD